MPRPVIIAAPERAILDEPKVACSLCMPRQPVKTRTLTDTLPVSVDKIVEGEEGKIFSSSNNKIPTVAQLYAAYPQDKRKSYKAVPEFFLSFVCFGEIWMVVWELLSGSKPLFLNLCILIMK